MPRLMLSDDQYERIRPLLSRKDSDPGRTAADNRRFVKAVLGITRTNNPWRDLSPNFGFWNNVYNRFARRSQAEIGHFIFAELASDADFSDTSKALPLFGKLKLASLAADKTYNTNAILQHLEPVGI